MGRSTINILIAPLAQGFLLGAVFPTTGMPDLPKSRLPPQPQLDPAIRQKIMNSLPQLRSLSEPQLSQAIMQIFVGQQNRFKAIQGGSIPLLNAAFHQQLQQMQQMQQQQ